MPIFNDKGAGSIIPLSPGVLSLQDDHPTYMQ
jgi:hypothetical protein